MEIKINTKFNVNDIAYGYHDGFWGKYRIDDIVVDRYKTGCQPSITYNCVYQIDNELCTDFDDYVTICTDFKEKELFTKEELVEMLNSILKDE